MAGYSGTPLVSKLGVKPGFRLLTRNAPRGYRAMLAPLPESVVVSSRLKSELDLIHFFTKSRKELEGELPGLARRIRQNGMIWVSWPKKASKVPTDVTEDVVRRVALGIKLVDVKVCAVDEVWSGLKLVIRKADRR